MPLFIDIHKHEPGLTKEAVIDAHAADLKAQARYNVKYLNYWYSEKTGDVFCLLDAPSRDAAMAVHREAHGLVADDVFARMNALLFPLMIEVVEGR